MVEEFVGRDHELAVVARLRARAAAGRRQVVVVSGEAGIGKTWFCERVTAEAERDGVDVVWGRCWPHGGAPALWPWPAVLAELTGPAGARLLGDDDSGRPDEGEPDDGKRVAPERFARFAAVADRLSHARSATPTMIVIDDLHNADPGALLLTRFLTGALDRLPLLLLLSRRAGGPALLDELSRDATRVPLRRFTMHETAALLGAHHRAVPDPRVTAALLQVTGGIPLFLAHAIGRGWADPGPATLQQAIADALARLPSRTRHFLALAAVLGAEPAIPEIAALAGEPPAAVVAALTEASAGGLVDPAPAECAFHDLVREAAIAQLGTAALLAAHARAAALLAGTGHPERVAHHALAAAARSEADVDLALAACREAAASLRRGFAYEQAATLLERAVRLAAHRPLDPDHVELLLEHAEAVLACGRLTEARAAFEAATDTAEQAGDPVQLARAVLGLGGVWVHEHRNVAVRQRVLTLQRAALHALPDREVSLRCRLTVRLAAEAVYEGGPVDAVLDALAQARTVGDARTLAEALSLTHHALLGPEHAELRCPLAEELITAGSAAGDGVLALFGLLWRTVDLYLAGDPHAERSLTELRQRAHALGVGAVGFVVACMDVMRLIRAGRLDEAEAAAGECLQLGLQVGDADATGCYGAQLLTIRWLQGRDAELAELAIATATSGTLAASEYGMRASIAAVLARGGRRAEARGALDSLLEGGLAALPRSSTWLAAMLAIVEAARLLGDAAVAAEAAGLLRPYAALPVMPSLAVSCFGAASRALGIAALTTGDQEAAVAHLDHAVETNQRWGHRPATAVCRAELAEALLERGRPADVERAIALLDTAVAEAAATGLTQREQEWSARVAALRRPLPPAVLRADDGWSLASGNRRIALPDLVGLRYLGELLTRPGQDVSATDLCAAVSVGNHEVLDARAVAAYRRRLRDVDAEIDAADADADLGRAERLRLEKDALTTELTGSLGLAGRVRGFVSPTERARTSVRKALKRALDAIADADPVLGSELRDGVSTGATCRYTPGARPWRIEVAPTPGRAGRPYSKRSPASAFATSDAGGVNRSP